MTPKICSRVNHGGFFESINRVLTEVTVMSALTALWVTLKHWLKRRPALVPKPSLSGVDNAQPSSPSKALALLFTLHSADIVLPTTDGREIRLRRITEPDAEQKSLLQQLSSSRSRDAAVDSNLADAVDIAFLRV